MKKVKITTNFTNVPIKRQLPNLSSEWQNCKFYINEEITKCDFWFVYRDLEAIENVYCAPDNTYFITGEPTSVKIFKKEFLNQFGNIITSQRNIEHSNVIYSQEGLPWLIGRKDNFILNYDNFNQNKIVDKKKLISVITSNKNITEGHRKRYEFVMRLKERFGENIDVFGRGINDIEDKIDAIANYKYHIVIENSVYDDYWTEKLSDTLLVDTYPIYYGCKNIEKYFPLGSYTKIDIDDFEGSCETIKRVIDNNTYENSIDKIEEAKQLILNKYNLFAMICDIVNSKSVYNNHTKKIILKPELFYKKDVKSLIKRVFFS